MIDLSVASSAEIVAEAKRILAILKKYKDLPMEVKTDYKEWMIVLGVRLRNDAKGVPLMTEEEIQEEIERWSEDLGEEIK